MSQFFNKIYLRYHARLILVITALCGFLTSHFMLKLGHVDIIIRYPVAAFVSYLVFVVLIYLWKVYLEGLPPIHHEQKKEEVAVAKKSQSRWLDYLDVADISGDFHEILIAIAVVGLFIVLIYASSYLLFEVPVLMIELILSSLATSFFYKKIKKADDDIFVFKVVKQTWLLGLAMVLIYTILGAALSASCPSIQRFSDLYSGSCF